MSRTARAGFRHAMGRDPRRVGRFSMPVSSRTPPKLDPQAFFHYWHPDRPGVEHCAPEFDAQLKLIHERIFCCRPPASVSRAATGDPKVDKYIADQRWIVWQRTPQIEHPLCVGWLLLFLWPPRDMKPIPLDNRVLANLAIINPVRYKGGIDYFNRVIAEPMADTKARQESADHQYRHDRAKDYQEATKIKNIGKGNKFALFHDGGVVPGGRGEENWLRELGPFVPGDVVKEDLESRHRATGKVSAPVGIDQHRVAQTLFEAQMAELKTRERLRVLIERRREEHRRDHVGGGSR